MGRALSMAIIICLGAAGLFFALVYTITRDATAAQGIGALPLLMIHPLAEQLKRGGTPGEKPSPEYVGGYTFHRFLIPWKQMIAYAAAAFYSLPLVLSFVVGFMVSASIGVGIYQDSTVAQIAGPVSHMVVLALSMVGAFVIGRWIGVRAEEKGEMVILASVVIAMFATHLGNFILMDDAAFMTVFGTQKNLGFFIGTFFFGTVEFLVAGFLGYWRGRTVQRIEYARKLIGMLPRESREVVTEILADEASRALAKRAG